MPPASAIAIDNLVIAEASVGNASAQSALAAGKSLASGAVPSTKKHSERRRCFEPLQAKRLRPG